MGLMFYYILFSFLIALAVTFTTGIRILSRVAREKPTGDVAKNYIKYVNIYFISSFIFSPIAAIIHIVPGKLEIFEDASYKELLKH